MDCGLKMEHQTVVSIAKELIFVSSCFSVSNKWIHEQGQELRRQCRLNREAEY